MKPWEPSALRPGRRGFLRSAAFSPLLLSSLVQDAGATNFECSVGLIPEIRASLAENQAFVTTKREPFPFGFFGFSLGHSHEDQLLLSRQLEELPKSEQAKLVMEKYSYLLPLFETDQVPLVPTANQIPAPLFLLPDMPAEWSNVRVAGWFIEEVDEQITGDKCFDLILTLLLKALGLEGLKKYVGKYIWKLVNKPMLDAIEAVIRARNWSGLAELAASLMEKLASKDSVELLFEVGGMAARKKFLGALASRFVPYVGEAIIVITLVGLMRTNWNSIRVTCLSNPEPSSSPS